MLIPNLFSASPVVILAKTIGAGEKLIEAERVMTRNKITSLLVTGDDGRLTGVIQIYDIKL